ncbi:MAG: hypothetical protein JWN46_1328 [Acidimicrobiales bacterium]|nr:hypothetical protein [Acidimicrobiales bacterium]
MDQTRDAARRQFLKMSGVGLAGAAFLAACSKKTSPVGEAGVTAPPDSSTTAPRVPLLDRTPTDKDNDLVQLRTATSIELLTVDVYGQVEQYLSSQAVPLAQRFRQQHQTHAADLQSLTQREFGLKASYDQPNPSLSASFVKPTLAGLVSDATNASDATARAASAQAFVRFLVDLENTGAASAVVALGILSLATMREAAGNIAALSARRAAAFGSQLGDLVPQVAFFSVESAAPIDALVK